jgi:hypothetical protein
MNTHQIINDVVQIKPNMKSLRSLANENLKKKSFVVVSAI